VQSEGYNVNVDRIGSAPLSECEVTSVRNPQEQTGCPGQSAVAAGTISSRCREPLHHGVAGLLESLIAYARCDATEEVVHQGVCELVCEGLVRMSSR